MFQKCNRAQIDVSWIFTAGVISISGRLQTTEFILSNNEHCMYLFIKESCYKTKYAAAYLKKNLFLLSLCIAANDQG